MLGWINSYLIEANILRLSLASVILGNSEMRYATAEVCSFEAGRIFELGYLEQRSTMPVVELKQCGSEQLRLGEGST